MHTEHTPTNGHDVDDRQDYGTGIPTCQDFSNANRADVLRDRVYRALNAAEENGALATIRTSITFKINFQS